MNTTKPQGAAKRAADSISGFDDPSMGDEREREVILRAYTFAMQLAGYLALLFALLLAVVGVGFWSITLILAAGIPSWAAIWYCKRESVDMASLVGRAGRRRKNIGIFVTAAFLLAWLAAVAFHTLTGAPLAPVDLTPGDGDSSVATVLGAVVGAVIGVLAVVAVMKLSAKRTKARAAAPEEDD